MIKLIYYVPILKLLQGKNDGVWGRLLSLNFNHEFIYTCCILTSSIVVVVDSGQKHYE